MDGTAGRSCSASELAGASPLPAQVLHDLRGHLTAVKGAWATLQLFDDQLHPQVRSELMEMVTRNIDLAVELVGRLRPGPQPIVASPSAPAGPLSGFDGLTGVGEVIGTTEAGCTELP